MRIQPIVEGDGEISAVPVLLRRLRDECGAYGLEVGSPIKRKRTQLVEKGSLEIAIRLARLQPDCGAILVLLDGDDDCPKELAPRLEEWAKAEARTIPCAVVVAQREYEAWFLATTESLRGKRGIRTDASSHPDPESVRGAKEALEGQMVAGGSYAETADQAALTALFDLGTAHSRSRSFRKMVKSFGFLARGAGATIGSWPPSNWPTTGTA